MKPDLKSPARAALVGLAAVAVAILAKGVLHAITGQDVAFIPMFVAVAVASMAGGFGAGVVVIAGGATLDAMLFQSPGGVPFDSDPAAIVRFLSFIPAGALIAWLVAAGRLEREAARSAAERFRQLLDDSPDFIILVDTETWTVEYANAACAAFGWQTGRLVGRSGDLVIPELRDLGAAPQGQSAGRAMTVLSEAGEARPVEVLTRPMDRGLSGRPLLFVSARDITERIESATRLMRLARIERTRAAELGAVIDSIDDAVGVFGPDGEVILTNEGMASLTGGAIASEPDLLARLGLLADAPRLEPGATAEIQLTNPERWLEMRRFAVRTDEADPATEASSLVVLRDTTVERVARETRETFLGILSHELRTPVTTILGIAHILNRSSSPASESDRQELAGDVLAEAERLHRLVEDLLVLSRTESGRLEYDPEPILIQHAIPPVIVAEARRTPEVQFVTNVPPSLPPIAGDRTYVDQVLRNLVGNAAKYGPGRGAEVIVQASQVGGEIVVQVLDRGPGFDPQDAARLFDIFFRASRTAHLKAGAGIGLFVTRSLVDMMGGRVWAKLRDGGGSEFGFALPILDVDTEP
jgi:PAS domain S-box-containing protein